MVNTLLKSDESPADMWRPFYFHRCQ